MKTRALSVGLVILAVLLVAGGAIARNASVDRPEPNPASREAISSFDELPVFESDRTLERDAPSRAQIAMQTTQMSKETALSKLDLRSVRDVSDGILPRGTAWVGQADRGKSICVLVRQYGSVNTTGFASGCSSLAGFNRAGLVSLSDAPEGKSIFISLQPSDVAQATATDVDGKVTMLPTDVGLTVALLAGEQKLSVGGSSIPTSALRSE